VDAQGRWCQTDGVRVDIKLDGPAICDIFQFSHGEWVNDEILKTPNNR